MIRAICRGIDSMEELERIEREKAEKEVRRKAATDPISTINPLSLPLDFEFDWNSVYFNVVLSPSVLRDMGFIGDSPQKVPHNQIGSF